jgi:hypothetical protein
MTLIELSIVPEAILRPLLDSPWLEIRYDRRTHTRQPAR